MKLDKQKYQQMLEQKSPNSPLWKDCLKAFLFGGAICTVGEGVSNFWQSRGLETADAAAATAITMVFLGALLTCLHLYESWPNTRARERSYRSQALPTRSCRRRWNSKARGWCWAWGRSCL